MGALMITVLIAAALVLIWLDEGARSRARQRTPQDADRAQQPETEE